MIAALALVPLMALGSPLAPGHDGLAELLAAHPKRFGELLEDPAAHRLQILLTEVGTDANGHPCLVRHGYRVDKEYFYPASAIKTCAAVAALALIEELADGGAKVSVDTPLVYHPLFDDEELEEADESNVAGGAITVRHELRKLFLVSDNRAYNRLYELVGNERLNRSMWAAGFVTTRVQHRLSEFRSRADQLRTPRVELRVDEEHTLTRPALTSPLVLDNEGITGLDVGLAHVRGGERVAAPFSFRYKNRISLVDLQDLHIAILRPDLAPPGKGFDLTDANRSLLRQAMGEYAGRSENPRYDPEKYTDDWVRFFLPGLVKVVPKEHLTVYDKVGRAYGFSIENACVVDERSGRSFFLSAVLYTNPNGTVNDGEYGYETIADPFFADLGEVVARALWGED